MTRSSIFPILLLVAAFGLFFSFTDQKYEDAKAVAAEVKKYDEALDKSKELQKIRDELLGRYNAISNDDRKRLELLLPDNVDNIRLILDIDTIASRYGIVIKDLKINSSASNSEGFEATAPEIKSLDLSFSFASDYETFITFLRDLEDSLRIIDVAEIKFAAKDTLSTASATHNLTIRTYWLP